MSYQAPLPARRVLWVRTSDLRHTSLTLGPSTLRWRPNGRDSVWNHQPHGCLLNRLFRRRSKKTSKLRATGLCAGNSAGTGEFPAQMASNAGNVPSWVWYIGIWFLCWFYFKKTWKCVYIFHHFSDMPQGDVDCAANTAAADALVAHKTRSQTVKVFG